MVAHVVSKVWTSMAVVGLDPVEHLQLEVKDDMVIATILLPPLLFPILERENGK